jgi:hypothetical protein
METLKGQLLLRLLVAFVLTTSCRQGGSRQSATAPEPRKPPLSAKEKLIGHWISEKQRPDGSTCVETEYFFQKNLYITADRIRANGRISRLDWTYRVVHNDENSVTIDTTILTSTLQQIFTFQDDQTLRPSSWDDKKNTWKEEAILHRVDDRVEP